MSWWGKFIGIVILLSCLSGCFGGESPAGSDGEMGEDGTDPLTPTPPVPVFGDFVLKPAAFAGSNQGQENFMKSMQTGGAQDPILTNSVFLAGGGIQVNETRNTLHDISFTSEEEELGNDETEIEFSGSNVLVLIRNGQIVSEAFPKFPFSQIDFGNYKKFKIRAKKLESELIPTELLQDPLVSLFLVDQSFLVEGSFLESPGNDLDGDGEISFIPFQVISDKIFKIEITSPNSFSVTEDIHLVIEDAFCDLLADDLRRHGNVV